MGGAILGRRGSPRFPGLPGPRAVWNSRQKFSVNFRGPGHLCASRTPERPDESGGGIRGEEGEAGAGGGAHACAVQPDAAVWAQRSRRNRARGAVTETGLPALSLPFPVLLASVQRPGDKARPHSEAAPCPHLSVTHSGQPSEVGIPRTPRLQEWQLNDESQQADPSPSCCDAGFLSLPGPRDGTIHREKRDRERLGHVGTRQAVTAHCFLHTHTHAYTQSHFHLAGGAEATSRNHGET